MFVKQYTGIVLKINGNFFCLFLKCFKTLSLLSIIKLSMSYYYCDVIKRHPPHPLWPVQRHVTSWQPRCSSSDVPNKPRRFFLCNSKTSLVLRLSLNDVILFWILCFLTPSPHHQNNTQVFSMKCQSQTTSIVYTAYIKSCLENFQIGLNSSKYKGVSQQRGSNTNVRV